MINDRAASTLWHNEAHVETLKRLWAEGVSASLIAQQIPGATRGAIIGKAHRLKLASHATLKSIPHGRHGGGTGCAAVRRTPRRTRTETYSDLRHHAGVVRAVKRKRAPESLPPAPVSDDATDLLIPQAQRRTLLTLEHGECKFGVGDPQDPSFFFCGASAEKKVDRWGNESFCPYCGPHMVRTHDTVRTRHSRIDRFEPHERVQQRVAGYP